MGELQASIEFSVEIGKFSNIDLFQRGFYQIRTNFKIPSNLPMKYEVKSTKSPDFSQIFPSYLYKDVAISKTFQVLYKKETINIRDVFLFKVDLLVESHKVAESLENTEFQLVLELWHSDKHIEQHNPSSLQMASSRKLQLHFSASHGLHYHVPVFFDYYHLSAVTMTVHASLIGLQLPHPSFPRPVKSGWLKLSNNSGMQKSLTPSMETILFGKSGKQSKSTQGEGVKYEIVGLEQAATVHRQLCWLLLNSYQGLYQILKENLALLPGTQQISLARVDVETRLAALCAVLQTLTSEDEIIDRMKADLSQLSGDLILLNQQFLEIVTESSFVEEQLMLNNHRARVQRFSEFFFTVDNPREMINVFYELNAQGHAFIAQMVKASPYYVNLPPLPIEFKELDGDATTLPVIFEEKYLQHISYRDVETVNLREIVLDVKSSSSTEKKDLVLEDAKGQLNATKKIKSVPPRLNSKRRSAPFLLSKEDMRIKLKAFRKRSLPPYQSTNSSVVLLGYKKYQVDDAPPSSSSSTSSLTMIAHQKGSCESGSLPILNVSSTDDGQSSEKVQPITAASIGNSGSHISKSASESNLPKHLAVSNNDFMVQKGDISNGFPNLASKLAPEETGATGASKIESLDSGTVFFDITKLSNPLERLDTLIITQENDGPSPPQNPIQRLEHLIGECSKEMKENSILGDSDIPVKTPSKNQIVTEGTVDGKEVINSTDISINVESPATLPSLPKEKKITIEEVDNMSEEKIEGKDSPQLIQSQMERKSNSQIVISSSDQIEEDCSINSKSKFDQSITEAFHSPLSDDYASVIQKDSDSMSVASKGQTRCNSSFEDENETLENKEQSSFSKTQDKQTESFPADSSNMIVEANNAFLSPLSKEFNYNESDTTVTSITLKTRQPDKFEKPGTPEIDSKLLVSRVTSLTNSPSPSPPPSGCFGLSQSIAKVMCSNPSTDITQNGEDSESQEFELRSHQPAYANGEFNVYSIITGKEKAKSFLESKELLKKKLKFAGSLYSDLVLSWPTIPYFNNSSKPNVDSPREDRDVHMIVCVHGLDGNMADLRLVRTYIELGLQDQFFEFVMSERNQPDTFADFNLMTDRLLKELRYYLEDVQTNPTRISFIGHSLGNIIIRSVLTRPELQPYLNKLHTFLSLSGPHLGTLYNNSTLVNTGMWLMQKLKKSASLQQLALKDHSDPRKTFLYQLSKKPGLACFKNVLLVGSMQDRYVPYHSARIEMCKTAMKDNSTIYGAIYGEMVNNLLRPVIGNPAINFVRYNIVHSLPNTANTFIGRAAHIAVLDSEIFIEKFMIVCGLNYFK